MKIQVHLYSQAMPIVISNADNAYTKDGLYCVMQGTKIHKFPVMHIFRVVEDD